MKKNTIKLFLMLLLALMMPMTATAAYDQLADGVYMDGTTLYITSGVTSLRDLQINPDEIYCYAMIPPACVSNTFSSYGATLHVPAAGMVSYFTALYWYNFNNILSDAIEPLSVTMNATEAQVEINHQFSLSATVAPSDATPKTVYWSSTDPSIATVSSSGTVTAVAAGECDILATCINQIAICHVTVTTPYVTISLDNHEARLLPNHTITLTATCLPIEVDLAVTSSNPEVAIPRLVNGSIMVVGVSEGTAVITVNAADGCGNPDSCAITVYTEHGDVNCDGYVSISDVTILIDYLLSDISEGLSGDNADTNNDGNVSISDVTTLIDYLLSGIWPWEIPITYMINGVSFKMVPIEGGTFTMGATAEQGTDSFDNESPTHKVILSDYSIGETEVTQELWLAVMGRNPSYFTGNLQRPVERVSWYECQAFITKLSQLTGRTFRLPTEAEWEFAARGGNKSKGYKYAGNDTISYVAWYSENSSNKTHPVGKKAPNELGLYDMSGNVWEWCLDWYDNYVSDKQTNPAGPASGSNRVYRGGSWDFTDRYCRVSTRSDIVPSDTYRNLGLRLVLGPDISPSPDIHESVDLGLPSGTLWATCNIGAYLPEEYGDFFAWGETEPKENYSWETYKWCNGSEDILTKYCSDYDYGTVDNKMFLDPKDDAAYMNWGPNWHMPSYDQQKELRIQCTWNWTTQNGIGGYLVTGPNGNSIFLPADSTRNGTWWSRTLYSSAPYNAYALNFNSEQISCYYYDRSRGCNVRAVRETTADFYVEQQSLDLGFVPLGETSMGILTIVNNTLESMTVTATVEDPFSFIQEEDSTSNMTILVPSQTSVPLILMFNGTTPGQFNSNVTIQKSALDEGQAVIPVHVLAYDSPSAQVEYVDLGLPSGTLWATCNVGASSPEEYGDYFAWGETRPKENYSWTTYKWCRGTYRTLTKYCTNDNYGTRRDNLSELESADDAAYVNMGPSWRIPTSDQQTELRKRCTWLWTTMNGINGYLIIGTNGNSLFLPAAGYHNYSSPQQTGLYGYYWSRNLNYQYPYYAYILLFNMNNCSSGMGINNDRCDGLAVRAVRVSQN